MKKIVATFLIGLLFISCGGDDNNDTSCNAPTDLFASDITSHSAIFEWGNSTGVYLYEVEYGPLGFSLGSGIIGQTSERQTLAINLNSNTSYQFYVTTICTNEVDRDISDPFSFTTTVGNANCLTPPNFYGGPYDFNSISLRWGGNGETSFRVEYGLTGFELGAGNEIITSETEINIINLNSWQIYDFYVQANCGADGFSEFAGPIVLSPY